VLSLAPLFYTSECIIKVRLTSYSYFSAIKIRLTVIRGFLCLMFKQKPVGLLVLQQRSQEYCLRTIRFNNMLTKVIGELDSSELRICWSVNADWLGAPKLHTLHSIGVHGIKT